MASNNWQILPEVYPPTWLTAKVGGYAAQLLWQRGLQTESEIAAFLDPKFYQPTPASAFGTEMTSAVTRIKEAIAKNQKVLIWGDFDADGITATSLLWEGLGRFFLQKKEHLNFYIPNRLTAAHGLEIAAIDTFKDYHLIITCDTGSTNRKEIDYLKSLAIDLIITDHHTLPAERPPVVAIINPRYFSSDHPLYHLSGVAVAYKLIEALYESMAISLPNSNLPDSNSATSNLLASNVPESNPPASNIPASNIPASNLLDLVAIGLVADLVQLKGDCRYLAQMGIAELKKKQRPGLKFLLFACNRAGDRATDIGFGLAPRLNSISRIWGDVRKCVEMLTSENPERCQELVDLAEEANNQRKSLQKKIYSQVKARIAKIDLSTSPILVIDDAAWHAGILGIVAGQIAQEYHRPVILLNTETDIARGSARSPEGIDLYGLIKGQEHFLNSFGGHPLAAGLSLPLQNLRLFRESIIQRFWQDYGSISLKPITIDLTLTISELGQELFRELKLLEPYGMSNPAPKLLIKNCVFRDKKNANIVSRRNQKLQYLKSEFILEDVTGEIDGHWWDKAITDIPDCACDVVAELVDNPYKKRYEVRIIDIYIIDIFKNSVSESDVKIAKITPNSSNLSDSKLNLLCADLDGAEFWQTLVGIAKYLSRTEQQISYAQLQQKLKISKDILALALAALQKSGWQITKIPENKISENKISEDKIFENNISEKIAEKIKFEPISPFPKTQPPEVKSLIWLINETRFRNKWQSKKTGSLEF